MPQELIYLVEDDDHQAKSTLDLVELGFGQTVRVEVVASESDFLKRFEGIAANRPACILLDIMLPWSATKISEGQPRRDSFMTAGLECCKKLRADKRTAQIPVLLYSVWDSKDIDGIPDGFPLFWGARRV